MAVTKYEENGVTLWSVYVNRRSQTNRKVRLQKRVYGFETEKAALAEEKKLLTQLTKQVTIEESRGTNWEDIIDQWEDNKLKYSLENSTYTRTTIIDYASMLRNFTKAWFGRPATELNRGDGRDVLRYAGDQGKSFVYLRRLKNTINLVYTWGIEERLIKGAQASPVHGIDLGKQKEDKLPEIWSLSEIQDFLHLSEDRGHAWCPVWTMALLTGMRSGELYALPWENLELVPEAEAERQESLPAEKRHYGLIRVVVNYNTRFRSTGPTKGGYWRTVPISGELYWYLVQLRKVRGNEIHVLPRLTYWDKGQQAQILRKFCIDIGLKSIKFHTLRACFATQLISSGVAPTTVMKICGWKDLKTMQRYIRMAGIDERGATEALRFSLRKATEKVAVGQVVKLFDFKAKR